ncbi:hypothetical protein SCHPADRAFT_929331 [Schizopora paradoxa]|uniref:Uncharacterized protein n=1 Tax=Schizopora paradoxa TaxID=27342 RepID=A0A0H2S624_9AGAM|nr:hypothetical protein SCHPADRAFT_929331 [Schizopora paradoxa]
MYDFFDARLCMVVHVMRDALTANGPNGIALERNVATPKCNARRRRINVLDGGFDSRTGKNRRAHMAAQLPHPDVLTTYSNRISTSRDGDGNENSKILKWSNFDWCGEQGVGEKGVEWKIVMWRECEEHVYTHSNFEDWTTRHEYLALVRILFFHQDRARQVGKLDFLAGSLPGSSSFRSVAPSRLPSDSGQPAKIQKLEGALNAGASAGPAERKDSRTRTGGAGVMLVIRDFEGAADEVNEISASRVKCFVRGAVLRAQGLAILLLRYDGEPELKAGGTSSGGRGARQKNEYVVETNDTI